MIRVIAFTVLIVLMADGPVLGPVHGRDMLYGEIADVDNATRTIWVRIDQDDGAGRVVQVLLPEVAAERPNQVRGPLSGCIAVGHHVRVWGGTDSGRSDALFTADEIRGCGMAACGDPTGVRSRLFRNRKEMVEGETCW